MMKAFAGLVGLITATPALAHPAQTHAWSHEAEAAVGVVLVILAAIAVKMRNRGE